MASTSQHGIGGAGGNHDDGMPSTTATNQPPKSTFEKNLGMLQELAMLTWMVKGDEAKDGVKTIAFMQLAVEAWNRVVREDQVDHWRNCTLIAIADFVKKHPNASDDELRQEIGHQIELFAAQVDALQG